MKNIVAFDCVKSVFCQLNHKKTECQFYIFYIVYMHPHSERNIAGHNMRTLKKRIRWKSFEKLDWVDLHLNMTALVILFMSINP